MTVQYDKLTPGQRRIALEIKQKYDKIRKDKEVKTRHMVIQLEKSLIRGDIRINKFTRELVQLNISPIQIAEHLEQIRRILREYFSIDMDSERI